MTRATVVIPTIPERGQMLLRAIQSAKAQTVDVDVLVQADTGYAEGGYRIGGAAQTRNEALKYVETPWIAFLDDDDELYRFHVEHCLAKADETGADLVYPWFDGANCDLLTCPSADGRNKVSPEGVEFNDEMRACLLRDPEWKYGRDLWNFIPMTVITRTELVRKVGGQPIPGTPEWPHRQCEDHGLWIRLLEAGAKFVHLPERTWKYHFHGSQSGTRLW